MSTGNISKWSESEGWSILFTTPNGEIPFAIEFFQNLFYVGLSSQFSSSALIVWNGTNYSNVNISSNSTSSALVRCLYVFNNYLYVGGRNNLISRKFNPYFSFFFKKKELFHFQVLIWLEFLPLSMLNLSTPLLI